MRKIFGMLSLGLLLASTGCQHTAGKCDCGATPGDAHTYAPYSNYQTPSVPVVSHPSGPLSTPEMIAPPKEMPKDFPKDPILK